MRQLEWIAKMMCKELIQEIVQKSTDETGRRICKEWLGSTLIDRCWGKLEYGRVMEDILCGETNLKSDVEAGLRDIRDVEEAEVAMLIRRQEKVERLRMAWKKRMRL